MGCGGPGKHEYENVSGRRASIQYAKTHPERVEEDAPVVYPKYWNEQGANFKKMTEISENDGSDFAEVQALLNHTFDVKKTANKLSVVKLERVEDSGLWADYCHSCAWITKCRGLEGIECSEVKNDKGEIQDVPLTTEHLSEAWKARINLGANEAYLWHGTDRKSAEGIAAHDFRIQSAGSAHGKKLGKGAYLAGSSSLADQYAPPDQSDVRTVILVRTALGKVHVTTKRANAWSNTKKVDRTVSTSKLVKSGDWDSVLGDRRAAVGGHREYCVAFAHQLYPEYLVSYIREK